MMSDDSDAGDPEFCVPVPKQQRVTQILIDARKEIDPEEKCDSPVW